MEHKDLHKDKYKYSLQASDYQLLEEIGQGGSAHVFRAYYIPLKEVVAIKKLNLEKCNADLDNIRKEAQTMSLISHPNVVTAHCSFVVGQDLWVVMPYLGGGSCLHIMQAAFSDGFEENVIAIILHDTLKALDYLHQHGHIHRDVKAGNILVDDYGGVKLGDFGISAGMFDAGSRQCHRKTFVGTPCWMAPEVIENNHGYDFEADIWSFGITAIELAHGHAPFAKYSPFKVFMAILKDPPPGLTYERDKRFSKYFKKMIATCLVKEPSKRPTAEKLLKHPSFKNIKSNDYIMRNVLTGFPPLYKRVTLIAEKKISFVKQDEKSQIEYKRGVSQWNFDIEDLRAQAAVLPEDECPEMKKEQSFNKEIHDVSTIETKSALSTILEHETPKYLEGVCLPRQKIQNPVEEKGRFKVFIDNVEEKK